MAGETENPKGAATQTPDGNNGQTPEETLTLTKKELEAREARARNSVNTDVKRLEAELTRSNQISQAALARLKVVEEERLRAEEAAVKDDPEKLAAWRLKREAAQLKQEAEEEKQRVATERAEVQTQYKEILTSHAERLAETYNVKPEYLLKYGGTSKASMEELAQTYGERNPKPEKPETPKVVTYSGQTKGGSAVLTRADVAKMSPAERNERAAEIAKLPFG